MESMTTEHLSKTPGRENPPPATNNRENLLEGKLARYLQEVELLRKPGTLRECRRICYAALPYLSPDNPRSGVLSFLMERKRLGIDPRTLENERIRLGAFYRSMGVKLDIPKFKFVMRKPEIYLQPELAAIFDAAYDRDKWCFRTLLMAGLREQEMMHLEYPNLLDTGIEITPHGDWTPKDHEERIVKVPKSLIEALRALPPVNGSPLVFPTERGTLHGHWLRTLKRTAKRAGLDPEKCWLHKFRANFCTTLLRASMALPDVMNQMGHSNVKSTMRYMALLGGDDLQSKVEAIWK